MKDRKDIEAVTWVCKDCGEKFGNRKVGVATWHIGQCDVCKEEGVSITEPRDYGYLSAEKLEEYIFKE